MSWGEARAMSTVERKAFLYTAAMLDGYTVDWRSGAIKPPPREPGV